MIKDTDEKIQMKTQMEKPVKKLNELIQTNNKQINKQMKTKTEKKGRSDGI